MVFALDPCCRVSGLSGIYRWICCSVHHRLRKRCAQMRVVFRVNMIFHDFGKPDLSGPDQYFPYLAWLVNLIQAQINVSKLSMQGTDDCLHSSQALSTRKGRKMSDLFYTIKEHVAQSMESVQGRNLAKVHWSWDWPVCAGDIGRLSASVDMFGFQ